MTREERIEVFILIREKMEEISDIIKANDAGPEFMSTYCFGLMCDDPDESAPTSYEFLTGCSIDGGDELNVMFNVMAHTYVAQKDDDDDDEPTNSIEYWLKK